MSFYFGQTGSGIIKSCVTQKLVKLIKQLHVEVERFFWNDIVSFIWKLKQKNTAILGFQGKVNMLLWRTILHFDQIVNLPLLHFWWYWLEKNLDVIEFRSNSISVCRGRTLNKKITWVKRKVIEKREEKILKKVEQDCHNLFKSYKWPRHQKPAAWLTSFNISAKILIPQL